MLLHSKQENVSNCIKVEKQTLPFKQASHSENQGKKRQKKKERKKSLYAKYYTVKFDVLTMPETSGILPLN